MKKLFFAFTALALSAGAFAQIKSDDIAKIKEETLNLGKIPQSIPAVSTFIVTNVGKTDLIIESANPTCGCTVGDYTKSPIKPGQTGTITATFNAANTGAAMAKTTTTVVTPSKTTITNVKSKKGKKTKIKTTTVAS